MATQIIRYSNRYAFEIVGGVDCSTDDVVVKDYAVAKPDMVYCVLSENNSYAHRHELVAKPISSGEYSKFLMSGYGPTFYYVGRAEKAKLVSEGVCVANEERNGRGIAIVYVGLKIAPFLKEKGETSLAECYAEIAKCRKEHADKQDEMSKLLAIGSNVPTTEDTAENLVEDIKWFLDNRKEIKAKCK